MIALFISIPSPHSQVPYTSLHLSFLNLIKEYISQQIVATDAIKQWKRAQQKLETNMLLMIETMVSIRALIETQQNDTGTPWANQMTPQNMEMWDNKLYFYTL